MDIDLVFDITKRKIHPAKSSLTLKQFNLMLFLGIRRTDESPGWVTCEEIAKRVPYWDQKVESVGKEISRYSEYSWFRFIEYDKISRGPYRLEPKNPAFIPNRDAAIERIIDPRPTRKSTTRHSKTRYLDPIELQAYDLIVQYGVYIPAVIDLIRQRIGNPERIRNLSDRLIAYRILATYKKIRGDSQNAIDLALKGLRLAEKLKYKDDIAYLYDQLGGIFYNKDDCDQARSYFEKEIKFLEEWGSQRAEFHLVGAYRGLAATLRQGGNLSKAEEAINNSKFYAKRSNNEEGMRIAAIEAARIKDEKSIPDLTKLIASQPSQHIVARVMTLVTAAEILLFHNQMDEGQYLLDLAFNEATRFHFKAQIDNILKITKKYKIDLKNK
jgi:tetratricopeptide (TPR) repeat protein